MKSGFGTCAFQTGDLKVGALVAVNALGDVYGADGEPMAGLLNQEKTGLSNTLEEMFSDAEGKGESFSPEILPWAWWSPTQRSIKRS